MTVLKPPNRGLIYGMGGIGEGKELNFSDRNYTDALDLAGELGIDFFDTAEAYSGGRSETILGSWLAGHNRKDFRIATKISPANLVSNKCVAHLRSSLKRLRTDYVDLYQVHWPNPIMSDLEVAVSLSQIINTGAVKTIGFCNHTAEQIQRIQTIAPELPIVSNQVEVNVFDTYQVERSVKWCESNGLFSLAYSPLGKGRINDGGQMSDLLWSLSSEIGMTSAQLALQWIRNLGQVFPVVASRTPEHLRENTRYSDFEATKEVFEKISAVASESVEMIPAGRIKVSPEGDGGRRTYTTLIEAVENSLEFFPSPSDLAAEVRGNPDIKPVKVIRSGRDLILVEGRIRYWGWVISFGLDSLIPAVVVESVVD